MSLSKLIRAISFTCNKGRQVTVISDHFGDGRTERLGESSRHAYVVFINKTATGGDAIISESVFGFLKAVCALGCVSSPRTRPGLSERVTKAAEVDEK